jgi:cell wall-associated NlpC family hydrolase
LYEIADLIGIPFVDEGRDPATGLDCWGLFVLAQKCLGNIVPDFKVSCFNTEGITGFFEIARESWTPVEVPVPGDAVLMTLDPFMPNMIQHFGVYLGRGRFLHTLQKTHSHLSRIDDRFYKNKIRGFYRWNP